MIAVDGDRGLAGRAVADDQFALAAAEGEHRVDDEHAGLQRLGDQIALDDAGAGRSIGSCASAVDRRAAVERAAERIDDAPEQARPTGTRTTSPVPRTASPASMPSASSSRTQPMRSRSRVSAKPNSPPAKSTQLVEPHVGKAGDEAMPSPTRLDAADPLERRAPAATARRASRRAPQPALEASSGVLCVTGQLLRDAIEIFAPAVAQDGMCGCRSSTPAISAGSTRERQRDRRAERPLRERARHASLLPSRAARP